MTDPAMRRAVFEALDNAVANGFDMPSLASDDIARDLKDCDADLASAAESDLVPIVDEWKERRNSGARPS
jgi:hypothetical protein